MQYLLGKVHSPQTDGLVHVGPQQLRDDPRWARLVDLVRELAFLDGGNDEAFTLASGRTSRWFFDMKPVMMHPEAGRLVGQLMNARCMKSVQIS